MRLRRGRQDSRFKNSSRDTNIFNHKSKMS
jgi:hypothetical protein